jgi:hypothetical protein
MAAFSTISRHCFITTPGVFSKNCRKEYQFLAQKQTLEEIFSQK